MSRLPITALLLALLVLMPGCLRRRMIIRSNPPGAMVYVDNQQIGPTPCPTDFIYYGTREIRLVKPGYETLTVNQPIPAPWYEIPPLDFVSENLVPREIQDYRTLSYNMVPQVIVPTEQLLDRAQQLRQSTNQGLVLPATSTAPSAEAIAPGMLGYPATDLPTPSTGQPAAPFTSPPIQSPVPNLAPSTAPGPIPGGQIPPPGGQRVEPLPAPVRY
jgi:PEGA domain-containing protein